MKTLVIDDVSVVGFEICLRSRQGVGAISLVPPLLPAAPPPLTLAPEGSQNHGGSRLALGFMPGTVSPSRQPGQVGRTRRPLPAISLGKGLVRKYEAEKMYGLRRDTGAMKLKRLSRRHYEVIARHLAGQSGEQIHIFMGLSISTISRILNDPLAQALIKRSYKDRQAELDALAGKAIGAVRVALEDGSTSEKLAAVDKYTKLKQSIAPESNPMESAEDFARAIVAGTVNMQVNIGR